MKNKIIVGLLSLFAFTACEYGFDPQENNLRTRENLLSDPILAEGILLDAYNSLPATLLDANSVGTDNAVSNSLTNSYLRIATGEWTSRFNPTSSYTTYYDKINRINYFLSILEDVAWSNLDEDRNLAFQKRFKGEALGLRAFYNFELLKKHGGIASNGELMGQPIVNEFLTTKDNFLLPRDSYNDVYQSIINDSEAAAALLPDVYSNDNESIAVNGPQYKNRINGNIVRALKARYALHAASPAFNNGVVNISIMEDAATYAAKSIEVIGGLAGLDSGGAVFYDSNGDQDRPEILWRLDIENSRSIEQSNFPPSLFGNGRTNPTQNLVDAFPDRNGFPISESTTYNEQNPYINRDLRLNAYVIYDGSIFKGQIINTNRDDINNKDGINNNTLNSTRTGYYLKKMLREDVSLAAPVFVSQVHFKVLMRYTELFLIYAEAANEVWGPDTAAPGVSYTARDVISAIRARAGIDDQYLSTVTSKEKMRDLIRNERRIELCFEGHRFWDLRRWELPLNETAKGLSIENGTGTEIEVEVRVFEDYMRYGPVPFNEVLRNNNMLQNKGW